MLIRLCLLWGAHHGVTADGATSVMMELKEEFGIADAEIQRAIRESPLLSQE
jgi:hypothetical protein